MKCPNCHTENTDKAKFCIRCGTAIEVRLLKYRLWILIIITVVISATVIAYMPSLKASFYLDDYNGIVAPANNIWQYLSSQDVIYRYFKEILAGFPRFGRQITTLSFILNFLHTGLDPKGFHWLNLLIHLGVGLSLFWVSYLFTIGENSDPNVRIRAGFTAVLVSALFLLHPLNIQAVTYVIQRSTSLATLFILLSSGFYLKARIESSTKKKCFLFVLSIFLWFLALGSKQIALILPVILVVYEICFHRSYWKKKLKQYFSSHDYLMITIPVIIALSVLIYLFVERYYSPGLLKWNSRFVLYDFTGYQRVLTITRIQFFYLGLMLWPAPSRLNILHDFLLSESFFEPWTTALAVFFWVGLTCGAIVLARKRPRYGFPLLIYLLLHMLESLPIERELIFEHKMYLPLTAFVFLFTNITVDLTRSRRIGVWFIVLVLAILLGQATYSRNTMWENRITFWEDAVDKSPGKARTYHGLGAAYEGAGMMDKAIEQYQKAIKVESNYIGTYRNLVKIHAQRGEFDKAEDYLKEFEHIILPNRFRKGGFRGSNEDLEAVKKIYPYLPDIYHDLGLAYAQKGFLDEAIKYLKTAIMINPEDSVAYYNMGTVYLNKNLIENALKYYELALEIVPETALEHYGLYLAYKRKGLIKKAMEHYRRAKSMDPSLGQ